MLFRRINSLLVISTALLLGSCISQPPKEISPETARWWPEYDQLLPKEYRFPYNTLRLGDLLNQLSSITDPAQKPKPEDSSSKVLKLIKAGQGQLKKKLANHNISKPINELNAFDFVDRAIVSSDTETIRKILLTNHFRHKFKEDLPWGALYSGITEYNQWRRYAVRMAMIYPDKYMNIVIEYLYFTEKYALSLDRKKQILFSSKRLTNWLPIDQYPDNCEPKVIDMKFHKNGVASCFYILGDPGAGCGIDIFNQNAFYKKFQVNSQDLYLPVYFQISNSDYQLDEPQIGENK